jgi:deoxyribodipyrimidine photo-lyase
MSKAIFWFRQDLRLIDNPGLTEVCKHHEELMLIYILDPKIKHSAQAWWLHHSLSQLINHLKQHHQTLILLEGDPKTRLEDLIQAHQIKAIYWNRCYDPASIERDQVIKTAFKQQGIKVQSFNASLLNEPWTIKNQQGDFFKVFTPYWKHCLKQLIPTAPECINQWPKAWLDSSVQLNDWHLLPTKPNWAKDFANYWTPGEQGAQEKLSIFIKKKIAFYKDKRNFPSIVATSMLSPHLHFGEISPWQIYRETLNYQMQHPENQAHSEHFLSELGWREFSYYLLYHFPQLITKNFKANFDAFPWHQDEAAFKKWQLGQTGYPIVDAGMRELWQTGGMHNRVRMIVASFLIKNLFIDWREGAKWFDYTLLDADTASNYASWQWVAGSGADAAPYFRIFNPILQGEKFDPEGLYVKKWVPELQAVNTKWIHQPWKAPQGSLPIRLGIDYPLPMVDHQQTRNKALEYYQNLKNQ